MRLRLDRNALVLFDPRNGDKVRFVVGRYTKAKRPELVDMKITDYCIFGCSFCYQGSTPSGKHATLDNITAVIERMRKARVLEVALGGGEPTDHPDFIEILRRFRNAGIVPNFTTKSLGWVKRNWTQIEPLVGAFAFSCEKASDVSAAAKSLASIPRERVNLHYVMGLQDYQGFSQFLTAAHHHGFRVTLLGYKTTGRGGDVVPHDYSKWIEVVQLAAYYGTCPVLSIDTPLAAEYGSELPVSGTFFHTKEGFVSAYIDAVKMGMSASSFDNETLIPLTSNLVADYAQVVPR